MKSSGMPTTRNNTPVESYSDYRLKKFESITEKTKELILLIKNSSLTDSDKKLSLLQIEFDLKKYML